MSLKNMLMGLNVLFIFGCCTYSLDILKCIFDIIFDWSLTSSAECAVSPHEGLHRCETTYQELNVNNTHPAIINPDDNMISTILLHNYQVRCTQYVCSDIMLWFLLYQELSADQWALFIHKFQGCFTHWGRVMHICVSKLTISGSDNDLSPGWRQAIIWTNAGLLSTGTLGTNFSEILNKIHILSLTKMHLKMSSGKWQTFCLSPNVLTSNEACCWRSNLVQYSLRTLPYTQVSSWLYHVWSTRSGLIVHIF